MSKFIRFCYVQKEHTEILIRTSDISMVEMILLRDIPASRIHLRCGQHATVPATIEEVYQKMEEPEEYSQ